MSSSGGGTHERVRLESLIPYKEMILSAISNIQNGTNILSLIINHISLSKEDSDALRALNTVFESNKSITYHTATVRDIYDAIGKPLASTRYFNFSPDGEEIEEVNAEEYHGTRDSHVEEIPESI